MGGRDEAVDSVGANDVPPHFVVGRLEEERAHVVPRHRGDRAFGMREHVRVVEIDPRCKPGVRGEVAVAVRAPRSSSARAHRGGDGEQSGDPFQRTPSARSQWGDTPKRR